MPAKSAVLRSQIASIAAHSLHAQVSDPSAHTAAARQAFLTDRFEREVDPDGVLTPDDRARRAAHARSAYFKRLALRSASARRSRSSRTTALATGSSEPGAA
jgi:hypothetical protein